MPTVLAILFSPVCKLQLHFKEEEKEVTISTGANVQWKEEEKRVTLIEWKRWGYLIFGAVQKGPGKDCGS